jgi:DNA-directed RNA polymerase subunit RPC12/RpoP
MTIVNSQESQSLEDFLRQQTMEIHCWHCGGRGLQALGWLQDHREMLCEHCGTLIVLNTTRMLNETALQLRQWRELHLQISPLMTPKVLRRRIPKLKAKRQFQLAIAKSHPDIVSGWMGKAALRRRQR